MLQAYRFYSRTDEGLSAAFDASTVNGARALAGKAYGLEIGQPADFLLLPAETLAQAVVDRPAARTVFRRGQVVARDGRLLESRL
jgi:cytosine deaminase